MTSSPWVVSFLATFLFSSFVGQIFLLEYSLGSTVRVKFSHRNFPGRVLPKAVNVTVTSDNSTAVLHLVQRGDVNVPVVTVDTDENGTIFTREEQTPHRNYTGIYQDVTNRAVILLTRHNSPDEVNATFTMKGKLKLGSMDYVISPRGRWKRDETSGDSSDDVIYYAKPMDIAPRNPYDYVISDHLKESNSPPSAGRERKRRAASSDYYIDIVAGVDYTAWDRFLEAEGGDETEARQNILEYYAVVFAGIDQMYMNIDTMNDHLNIRLIKLLVFKTSSSLPVEYLYVGDGQDKIDGQKVLLDFGEYLNTSTAAAAEILGEYDHFMLFVGLNLYSPLDEYQEYYSDLLGIAFLGQACSVFGVSVIEDIQDYVAIYTAVHELGHSLSAPHDDGVNKTCQPEDRYIMAPSDSQETAGTRLHPWLFSNCSTDAFKSFIETQLGTETGTKCLTETLPIYDKLPNVTGLLLGQRYSLDQQCQLTFGQDSYNCRQGNSSTICSEMFCFAPNEESSNCKYKPALPGTSCGNKKICKGGDCVFDQGAPSVLESFCPFSDIDKIPLSGSSCTQMIEGAHHRCYIAEYQNYCCNTCQSIRRDVKGCEFGDRVANCSSDKCINATSLHLKNCCETCSNQSVNTCQDDPVFLADDLKCQAYVKSSPSVCYDDYIRKLCCQSCSSVRTNLVGCEYGDRFPKLCPLIESCLGVTDLCCATCENLKNDARVLHPALSGLMAVITVSMYRICCSLMNDLS